MKKNFPVLDKVKKIISSNLDSETCLKKILLFLNKKYKFTASIIFYWNDEEKRFEMVRQVGLSKKQLEKFNSLVGTMLDTITRNKKLQLFERITGSVLNLTPEETKQLDINCLFVYQMLKSNKLIGFITFCKKKGSIEANTTAQLNTISPILGLLVENNVYHDRIIKYSNFVNFDGLTGLFNHRYFQEALANELFRAQRFNYPVSLLMIDVDHFKDYNDKYSHPQGDFVLKEISKIIKESIRAYDIPSRYGGEEMTVILPYTTQQQAMPVAERIRKNVSEHMFPGATKNEQVKVTVSIGVATFPLNAKTKVDLIDRADQALYLAKAEGRNRVCLSLVVSRELIRVGFCPPAFTSSYYRDILAGVEDVIKEISNIELVVKAPEQESDYEKLKMIFSDFITEKLDAVAICSQWKGISQEIKKFNDAGIPVFMFNVPERPHGVIVRSVVGYNQKEAGREVGRYLVRLLRGKGNLVILEGLNEITSQQRIAGFREIVEANPKMKIIESVPADWLREKAQIVTEEILKKHENIDAIFAVNDEMALGAVEAVTEAGKINEIFIIGFDGTISALRSIKEGKLTATLNTNPQEMGRILLRTIVRSLIKEERIDPEIFSPINIVDMENTSQVLS